LTLLNNNERTMAVTFTAGLASGLTEAIMVVTPAEVCEFGCSPQYHSMMDPAPDAAKYTNVFQTAT
jgi:solute carrier family 25 citrate transporter 1